ncbi:alpha/beta fold hydrolase [Kribbia dieselivorans]|uniref:alpha/beta fold hydrolase n=1 Tax=Kribbia dieselivorans TaxID=331526 RepID=UPI0008393D15|nr:alpha/beta hydrolase [Kribbia dieselivorans]
MTSPSADPIEFTSGGVRIRGDKYPAADETGVALLLHGGGQTRHSWRRTAVTLAEHGWTTVNLDARGHGDSEWADDGDYSMDAFVGDIATLVDQLGQKPVLIGASMGGLSALLAVGEGRVPARGMVLVDVVPRIEPEGSQRIQTFMTSHPDGFATLEEVADAVASYNPHRPRPTNLEGLKKNVRLHEDGRWHWHWDPAFLDFGDEPSRALREQRFIAAAAQVTVPTLVVRGGESDVVSVGGVQALLDVLPSAQEVVVPKAGHMIAGDDNSVFGAQLITFLDELA